MEAHTGDGDGHLDVLLGLMECFAPAASEGLGWCSWRGSTPRAPQQLGKSCLR